MAIKVEAKSELYEKFLKEQKDKELLSRLHTYRVTSNVIEGFEPIEVEARSYYDAVSIVVSKFESLQEFRITDIIAQKIFQLTRLTGRKR